MGAICREEDETRTLEHGVEHGHVIQMGSTAVDVVGEKNVTAMNVAGKILQNRLHGPRHRHHVYRQVESGLCDQASLGVEQGAGEVLHLADGHGIGGSHHGGAHFAHDGDEPLGEHLHHDRIELFICPRSPS